MFPVQWNLNPSQLNAKLPKRIFVSGVSHLPTYFKTNEKNHSKTQQYPIPIILLSPNPKDAPQYDRACKSDRNSPSSARYYCYLLLYILISKCCGLI